MFGPFTELDAPLRSTILYWHPVVPFSQGDALPVLSNFELLLENWRSSADPLAFHTDIYFDTVGDLVKGMLLFMP